MIRLQSALCSSLIKEYGVKLWGFETGGRCAHCARCPFPSLPLKPYPPLLCLCPGLFFFSLLLPQRPCCRHILQCPINSEAAAKFCRTDCYVAGWKRSLLPLNARSSNHRLRLCAQEDKLLLLSNPTHIQPLLPTPAA